MDRPSATTVWCFVDEGIRAGRRERCFIAIECSVELCFSGESWIYAGGLHEVECLGILVDEPASQVHGEMWIETG
jgi:hypothetical protein